jgi:hypothetical protein
MRIRGCALLLAASLLGGCKGEPKKNTTINRDTMTQRQKDSVNEALAKSGIPGAGNIQRAQRVADSMSRQVQTTDTIH